GTRDPFAERPDARGVAGLCCRSCDPQKRPERGGMSEVRPSVQGEADSGKPPGERPLDRCPYCGIRITDGLLTCGYCDHLPQDDAFLSRRSGEDLLWKLTGHPPGPRIEDA